MVQTRSRVMGVLAVGVAMCGCGKVVDTDELGEELKAGPGHEPPRGNSAVVVTPTSGLTSESGAQVRLGVRLRHKPRSDVTISVVSDTPSEAAASPAQLSFTRDDWNVEQTVAVTGTADLVRDGDQPYGVVFSASASDHRYRGKTWRVRLTNRDVAPQLQRIGLNAFQDFSHGFVPHHGEFFVYAAYPPDVTLDEFGTPSSPGQLWLYDRATGGSRLITRDAAGGYGNGTSDGAAVAGDGCCVAFRSTATNLGSAVVAPLSTNVFLYDRATGSIELVSRSPAGESADSSALMGVPSISDDGRFIAFLSSAGGLVDGDDDGATDFFVWDRQTGTLRLISDSSGTVPDGAYKTDPAISGNGQFMAFVSGTAADPDNRKGVFVQDLSTGSIERADVSSMGTPGNSFVHSVDISDDGRYVAFSSFADNLLPVPTNTMQVFVRDRVASTLELASVNENGEPGTTHSSEALLSADGRFVAFLSGAPNLTSNHVTGGSGLYVHDRRSGRTSLLSVSLSGTTGNGPSNAHGLAGDGGTLVFQSAASDLVAGDTTTYPQDLFIASVPRD